MYTNKGGCCLSGGNVCMYVHMYMTIHVQKYSKHVLFIVVATPTVATVGPPDATGSMAALSPPSQYSPHYFDNRFPSAHSPLPCYRYI